MAAFIVTYDLNQHGQKYDCIIKKLEALGAWHMQQSVWIVTGNHTSENIRNSLRECLDGNDSLFVGRIADAAWNGLTPEAAAWLIQKIR